MAPAVETYDGAFIRRAAPLRSDVTTIASSVTATGVICRSCVFVPALSVIDWLTSAYPMRLTMTVISVPTSAGDTAANSSRSSPPLQSAPKGIDPPAEGDHRASGTSATG